MIRKLFLFTAFLLPLLACNLMFSTPGSNPISSSTKEPQEQIDQAVSQTFDSQTQVAGEVQGTLTAMSSSTPAKPTDTPSPTITFTPQIPRVSVTTETNCRSGPGAPYDILGVLPVGESAEVVGRNASGDTWIIHLPSNPAILCWLWGYYATVSGDISHLSVYDPPPSPTPAPGFIITHTGTTYYSGWIVWSVDVTVQNNGSITWQSNRVVVKDDTSGTSLNGVPENKFAVPPGGPITSEDLTPGEIGGIFAAPLHYDPAGHHLTVTITLCTLDSLAGACVSKVISFVP